MPSSKQLPLFLGRHHAILPLLGQESLLRRLRMLRLASMIRLSVLLITSKLEHKIRHLGDVKSTRLSVNTTETKRKQIKQAPKMPRTGPSSPSSPLPYPQTQATTSRASTVTPARTARRRASGDFAVAKRTPRARSRQPKRRTAKREDQCWDVGGGGAFMLG